MEATTAGPIVRFGTKWPSMTSICSRSAQASAASFTCSPRRSNRADRIEGAILIRIGVAKGSWPNKGSFHFSIRRNSAAVSAQVIRTQDQVLPHPACEHLDLDHVLRGSAEPHL